MALPIADPATSPIPTPAMTQAMPMAILAPESSTCSISSGARRIAATAPAMAATRVNIAVISPWRYPEMAARITNSTTTTSTTLIGGRPDRPWPRSRHSRQVEHLGSIPRLRPTTEVEQDIDEPCRETPDQQIRHRKCRTDKAAGVFDNPAVGGVDQIGHRHSGDR